VDAKGNSPAKKWLEAVISHAGCPVSLVVIPSEHQDANDWTRAGATQEDVWTAIESAEPQASQAAPEETDNSDTMIVLPANGTSITKCAEKLFTKISRDTTLFSRNGRVMEVSVLKSKAILQVVSNHGFRSRIEQYGSCYIERSGANGETVLKATIPSVDAAAALLEAPAVNLLPPIAGLVNAPVLLNDEKGCRLVEQGYDRGSSLMVTGGAVLYPIPLEEATKALHEMLAEFAFQTPGDRSRALAALITPALRFGGHIRGPIPIDLAEADDSQSGKTYRIKCTAAIYNGLLSFVSQKNGGVGSYEETFDQALINGQPFILFDNWRGKFDSPHLEAFITAQGIFPARVPYKGLVNIDTTYFILSMTSNGLETTRDLAKRSSIVRIRKRPGHAFKEYAEGELLDHVVANQAYYLGCVFAIVQAWLEAGKPRTNERRHDFREWSQSLDWIVQNLLKAAPLLDDHESAQQRVSSPGLSFVRQIALAVEASGSLNEELTCTAIYCLASECGVEIPMLRAGDQSSGARTIGTHLGKLFTPEENVVESEGFNIQRNKVKMARDNGQGPKDQNRFIFSRPATPVSPQNAKE
jgi:hypothetical protein